MTDGQVFYLAALAGLFAGALIEHLWKKWRR